MASSGPAVSICIPAHNAERWVRAAVESALAQTWPLCEVIVVDDGSTDGTPEILAAFGDRIRLLPQEESSGSNPSRNRAWREARGQWLLFLDADDYLLPGKVEQQLHEGRLLTGVDRSPMAALIGPVLEEVWRDGEAGPPELCTWRPELDFAEQWLRWTLPQTSGVLWNKEAFASLGGWNEDQPSCQEYECYLRLLQSGADYRFTRHAGAVYRLWSEQTLCRRDPAALIATRTALMDRMTHWLQESGQWKDAYAVAAGQAFFEMARTLARGDLETARVYARERQRQGHWEVVGPAAPWRYRLAYLALGFVGAEKLARGARA